MNIYSMEELCYYLSGNSTILDRDIMDLKLCQWIERETGLRTLGVKLYEMIMQECQLSSFVTTILGETGYCTTLELNVIEKILIDSADMGFAQKRKMRGDNLLRANKFSLAIDEYQYILNKIEREEDEDLYGSILYNMATAYAKLFLFQKAMDYYKLAYDVSGDADSYKLYLVSMRMSMSQSDYTNMILVKGLNKESVVEVEEEIAKLIEEKMDTPYASAIERIRSYRDEGQVAACYQEIESTLNEWKKDYRKNMMNI
ncbi:MAG: hypothetical protein GX567_14030, partial [Clostridia bacterium]|nr:hypothetical protein [Clostridia bacterium]